MTQVSQQTQKLVEQLRRLRPDNSWFAGTVNGSRIIVLLEQITDNSEIAVVPFIAQFLFSASKDVRKSTCQAIHRVVSSLPPLKNMQLSSICSESNLSSYFSHQWDLLQPTEVSSLIADQSSRSSLLGMLSFHTNGYVRHEAVHQLGELRDGSELPFLLIRQNDWVKPISDDALEAVWNRLNDEHLADFVSNLPLVLHLRKFSRHDHSEMVSAVVQMLLKPENDALLVTVLRSSSTEVKREVLRVALGLAHSQRSRIIRHGLVSSDAVIRYWCTRQMRDCLTAEELLPILDRMQRDRFMPARREALTIEADLKPEKSDSVWRGALLDSHASIRDLAQFHLRKTSEFDVPAFYRDQLAVNRGTLSALCGLGETGASSDVATIRGFLNAKLPSWRAAAVRGIAALGEQNAIPELIQCLCDNSPRVIREAGRALLPLLNGVDGEVLFQVVEKSNNERSQQTALRLIAEKGKWSGLPWLIRSVDHHLSSVATEAQSLIARWIFNNRNFTLPSPSQRMAIREALSAKKEALPKSFLEKLKNWLGDGYF